MTSVKHVLTSERIGRVIFTLVALSLMLSGIETLRTGEFFYKNYWDGLVFVPVDIAIGAFCLYLAVFRWHKLGPRSERLKGRAARSAQR
jgi:hypothetical protein